MKIIVALMSIGLLALVNGTYAQAKGVNNSHVVPVTCNPSCPPRHWCKRGTCVAIRERRPIINHPAIYFPCRNVHCPMGNTCLRGICVPRPPPRQPHPSQPALLCHNVHCAPNTWCRQGQCVAKPSQAVRPVKPAPPPAVPVTPASALTPKASPPPSASPAPPTPAAAQPVSAPAPASGNDNDDD